MMAVLRMLAQLNREDAMDLRAALDIPRPDEDAYMAADRWLSSLSDVEERARSMIALIAEVGCESEIHPK
jgi:hypothetical protein